MVSEGQLIRLTEVHRRCQQVSGRKWSSAEFYRFLSDNHIRLWEKRGKLSHQFDKDAITVTDFVKLCWMVDTETDE